jgi:tRNA (guanine-N7-)-methyltransferase
MTAERPIRRRSVYADRLREFPEFAFSDGAEFEQRGAWREFFRSRMGEAFDGRVIFEIGCNDGSLLARIAAKHPTTAFIGIDWKYRALHTAAGRVAAAALRNVALLHGRGQDVGRIFADGEVDEIWVFHPDPCDKPQELRNRLVAEPFLIDVHRVLRDQGSLVLKTDHPEYYQWAVSVSEGMSGRFEVTARSSDFWADESVQSKIAGRCYAGESTFFENRYRKKRRPIYFLELQKR